MVCPYNEFMFSISSMSKSKFKLDYEYILTHVAQMNLHVNTRWYCATMQVIYSSDSITKMYFLLVT